MHPNHPDENDFAERLSLSLAARGVGVSGFALDRPLRPDGEHGIDLRTDAGDLHATWSAGRGYGVYAADPGYGEMPAKRTYDPDAAASALLGRMAA